MKYTLEQIQYKTNAELNEICALAQEWIIEPSIDGGRYVSDDGCTYFGAKCDYTPTTNKEHAWDLMVKYSLIVDVHWSGAHYIHYGENDSFIDNETDLLRAVTIASILAAQGE